MLVPLNLTGGDFQHKSRPESNQQTRNFWPQAQTDPKAKSPYILKSFYGLKLWKAQSGMRCRGVLKNQDTYYRVLDTTLYSVASDGTHTALGTVPGSNRCILKGLGEQVVLTNGSGAVYIWDGTTFSQNTSVNLGSPKAVAVLNSQAIYDQGSGQGFDVSDAGLPGTINGLNNAAAESSSDHLNLPYAFRETLYLVGDETIELWWNSGNGNPPFDKIQGAQILVGSNAIHSFAETPDFIFFLGSDDQFHSLTGGSSAVDTVISTEALNKIIQGYTTKSDCIGWTMQLEGKWFYCATFPHEDVTWVLPIGGQWFQWGSGRTGRIRANSYVKMFNKHLVTIEGSGDIYELDPETYTDADETIIRTRITAPIHAGLLKADGKAFEINDLQIILETGVGTTSGQGVNPLLGLSVSRDGGKSFGTQQMMRCGALGELVTVNTGPLGRFDKDCVLKLEVSDPIDWNIYGGAAEMELCI